MNLIKLEQQQSRDRQLVEGDDSTCVSERLFGGRGGGITEQVPIKLPRAYHVEHEEPIICMATQLSFLDNKSSPKNHRA